MTELEERICKIANPEISASYIVRMLNCEKSSVYRCIDKYNLIIKRRKKSPKKENSLSDQILSCSGKGITSAKIAFDLGCSAKYVQNVLRHHDAPRLPQAPRRGIHNPSYKHGRIIDLDGYVTVPAPLDHPNMKKNGRILEHRLILEQKLDRYLLPKETVDHIDGLRLHNSPDNLRLFDCNADHLKSTITGQVPQWSKQGLERMKSPRHVRAMTQRVDTYHLKKVYGVARLIQIVLAMLALGKGSPFLLGTSHHLKKAGIVDFSRSNLKHELERLYQQFS